MYVTVFDNCLFSVEISIDIGFKVSVNVPLTCEIFYEIDYNMYKL